MHVTAARAEVALSVFLAPFHVFGPCVLWVDTPSVPILVKLQDAARLGDVHLTPRHVIGTGHLLRGEEIHHIFLAKNSRIHFCL